MTCSGLTRLVWEEDLGLDLWSDLQYPSKALRGQTMLGDTGVSTDCLAAKLKSRRSAIVARVASTDPIIIMEDPIRNGRVIVCLGKGRKDIDLWTRVRLIKTGETNGDELHNHIQ